MPESETAGGVRAGERIPVESQPHDRWYEMSIRFVGDAVVSLPGISGMTSGVTAPDAVVTHIRQVVPFIPDDETLTRYASIIESQASGRTSLRNVRFQGYEYLRAVEPPPEDARAGDTHPA